MEKQFLKLKSAAEVLDLVGQYYPARRIPVKTQYLVEGLFEEGKAVGSQALAAESTRDAQTFEREQSALHPLRMVIGRRKISRRSEDASGIVSLSVGQNGIPFEWRKQKEPLSFRNLEAREE